MGAETIRKKKTTIYDIAGEVGTSTATVSRVLSDCGYPVKAELRQVILDTAKKMNYMPNIIGRMLKGSSSREIGVILPTISNPFYPQILLGIELEARQEGYGILLCNSFRDPVTERKYMETLYQKQVTGLIISSINENHTYLKEMQTEGVNIVVFDQDFDEPGCSRVGFDYVKGGKMGTAHLLSMGHKDIAFITSPLTKKSRRDTLEGYRLALQESGISVRRENIIVSESEEELRTGTYEFENGKMMTKKLLNLAQIPTAVFAINDMTALGVVQELIENGVKVPEDISVLGFDNIEISSMVNPPLTTIDQPSFETGRRACRMLIDKMKGTGAETESVTLEPTLVIRRSVARPNILYRGDQL
jgi:LacI family transcriptional regulator